MCRRQMGLGSFRRDLRLGNSVTQSDPDSKSDFWQR